MQRRRPVLVGRGRGLHFAAGIDARASAAVMGTQIDGGLGGAPAGTDAQQTGGRHVHLVLGNRDIGERSFRGNLFYVACYREALSRAEVDANLRHPSARDDDRAVRPEREYERASDCTGF